MPRLLYDMHRKTGMRVSEIDGGGLRNAIPRESFATVVIDYDKLERFEREFNKRAQQIKFELRTTEPDLTIAMAEDELPNKVMTLSTQEKLIRSVYAAQNGVFRMSADIPDLVETSNNVARVMVKNGEVPFGRCVSYLPTWGTPVVRSLLGGRKRPPVESGQELLGQGTSPANPRMKACADPLSRRVTTVRAPRSEVVARMAASVVITPQSVWDCVYAE